MNKREKAIREEISISRVRATNVAKRALKKLGGDPSVVNKILDADELVDFCIELDKRLQEVGDGIIDVEIDESQDNEDSEFDDEREGEFDMSAFLEESPPEETEEEEEEPPKKTAKVAKKPKAKKTKPANTAKRQKVDSTEISDYSVHINKLMDLITNQGQVIDNLTQEMRDLSNRQSLMMSRQTAQSAVLANMNGTIFGIHVWLTELAARLLKTFKFKSSIKSEISKRAEKSSELASEGAKATLGLESD